MAGGASKDNSRTDEFKREAWVQAQVRGMKADGYSARNTDLQEVERRKAAVAPVAEKAAPAPRATPGAAKVKAAGVNSQLAEAYVRRENRKLRVLWRSEPLYDLALMVSAKVPEKTARAVAKAFLAMHLDPRGRAVLRHASRSVGLPDDAYFISSNGSEYAAYRKFYQTAPSQLR